MDKGKVLYLQPSFKPNHDELPRAGGGNLDLQSTHSSHIHGAGLEFKWLCLKLSL